MKDLPRIQAAYARIDAMIEATRINAAPQSALQIEARQVLNDQAYFVLRWGHLEIEIDDICRQVIRRRQNHLNRRVRRAWDLHDPNDKRLSGLRVPTGITASFGGLSLDGGDYGNEAVIPLGALTFQDRAALVSDQSAGQGSPYAKTMKNYETRNRIAHGKLRSARIDITTTVRDFHAIPSALHRGL